LRRRINAGVVTLGETLRLIAAEWPHYIQNYTQDCKDVWIRRPQRNWSYSQNLPASRDGSASSKRLVVERGPPFPRGLTPGWPIRQVAVGVTGILYCFQPFQKTENKRAFALLVSQPRSAYRVPEYSVVHTSSDLNALRPQGSSKSKKDSRKARKHGVSRIVSVVVHVDYRMTDWTLSTPGCCR